MNKYLIRVNMLGNLEVVDHNELISMMERGTCSDIKESIPTSKKKATRYMDSYYDSLVTVVLLTKAKAITMENRLARIEKERTAIDQYINTFNV